MLFQIVSNLSHNPDSSRTHRREDATYPHFPHFLMQKASQRPMGEGMPLALKEVDYAATALGE